VSVLLAQGTGAFSPAKTYAEGSVPRWVAAADLNGDGRPDLVAANPDSNDLTVLFNDCQSR
jgi:hypothetical protein